MDEREKEQKKIVQDAPWNEDSQPQAAKHTVEAMTWYPGSCSPQWMHSSARFLECKQPTCDKVSPAPSAISWVPSAVRSPAWLPRPPPRPRSPLNHFASFFFLMYVLFPGLLYFVDLLMTCPFGKPMPDTFNYRSPKGPLLGWMRFKYTARV